MSMQFQPQPEPQEPQPEPQELEPEPQSQKSTRKELYSAQLQQKLNALLHQAGDPSSELSPLARMRIVRLLVQSERQSDLVNQHCAEISAFEAEQARQVEGSLSYLDKVRQSLDANGLKGLMRALLAPHAKNVGEVSVSLEMPEVSAALQEKMLHIETFLGRRWAQGEKRGVLAIHTDEQTQTTVIQVGIAAHGPIYIQVHRILRPEDIAAQSLGEFLEGIGPFRGDVDPLAIINGTYQQINFSRIFHMSRVVRAASGNTGRLEHNLAETAKRERLSPENTAIINSAPASQQEYVRVFPQDRAAQNWGAWAAEARGWEQVSRVAGFSQSPQASEAQLLQALTQTKNVIVIMAHCDGESIFLPEPPPNGTQVTAGYLREHKREIGANAPFVYLFSCHGGDVKNLQNFASILLDCGASGVVAAQGQIAGAMGQSLLTHLLRKDRGAPPMADFQNVARHTGIHDMEVYLA
jgi:hypothetical protein